MKWKPPWRGSFTLKLCVVFQIVLCYDLAQAATAKSNSLECEGVRSSTWLDSPYNPNGEDCQKSSEKSTSADQNMVTSCQYSPYVKERGFIWPGEKHVTVQCEGTVAAGRNMSLNFLTASGENLMIQAHDITEGHIMSKKKKEIKTEEVFRSDESSLCVEHQRILMRLENPEMDLNGVQIKCCSDNDCREATLVVKNERGVRLISKLDKNNPTLFAKQVILVECLGTFDENEMWFEIKSDNKTFNWTMQTRGNDFLNLRPWVVVKSYEEGFHKKYNNSFSYGFELKASEAVRGYGLRCFVTDSAGETMVEEGLKKNIKFMYGSMPPELILQINGTDSYTLSCSANVGPKDGAMMLYIVLVNETYHGYTLRNRNVSDPKKGVDAFSDNKYASMRILNMTGKWTKNEGYNISVTFLLPVKSDPLVRQVTCYSYKFPTKDAVSMYAPQRLRSVLTFHDDIKIPEKASSRSGTSGLRLYQFSFHLLFISLPLSLCLDLIN